MMKKSILTLLFSCLFATATFAVDNGSGKFNADTLVMETQSASLENKYASASVTMTLPVGSGIAQTIRKSLLKLMGTQIYEDADYAGDGTVKGKPFTGDTNNLKAVCDFYCKAIFNPIAKQNRDEYDSNIKFTDNDTTSTEEEKQNWRDNFPTYEQEITLSKVCEAANYIVFYDMSYGSRGGAHGGVSGYGYIIFNRTTGQQVKTLIRPGSAKMMQRLLMDGLKRYIKDCGENVSTDRELLDQLTLPEGTHDIPLPQCNGIAPDKDGLTFSYSQYEIAPYALGMPEFTIPYDKVRNFMTDEALQLLKK